MEPPDPVGGSCLEIEASWKACESFLSASLQGFISCSQSYLGWCMCVCVCVYCFQGCLLRIWFWNFYFLLIASFFKPSGFFEWFLRESSNPGMTKSLEEFGLCEGNLFVFGMNHPVTDFCNESSGKAFRSTPSLHIWGNWDPGRESVSVRPHTLSMEIMGLNAGLTLGNSFRFARSSWAPSPHVGGHIFKTSKDLKRRFWRAGIQSIGWEGKRKGMSEGILHATSLMSARSYQTSGPQLALILPPGNIGPGLETFLFVTTWGRRLLLASHK